MKPSLLYLLFHTSFTAPFILTMFTRGWDRLLFWFLLNTIILNLSALSWRGMSLFQMKERPNFREHRKMTEESPFRALFMMLNLFTFTKFALWHSATKNVSFWLSYYWIQSFIILTLTVFSTTRFIFIVLTKPQHYVPPRRSIIKGVFIAIALYIIFFGMLGCGVKQFKIEPPTTPYNYAEIFLTSQDTTQSIPNCKNIEGVFSLFHKVFLTGALLCTLLELDDLDSPSPIFDTNARATKYQKFLYLCVSIYGSSVFQYTSYSYASFFFSALNGKIFNCSSWPTINFLYLLSGVWFLIIGQVLVIAVVPVAMKRNLKDFGSEVKYYGSILHIKYQYLTMKIYEKAGGEIDEKQRQKLQKLELQVRVSPLSGFDYKLAPTYMIKDEDCSICLEELCNAERKIVYWRVCLHFYHENCLKLWIKEHAECPMCKQVK